MSISWHKIAASADEIPFSQDGLVDLDVSGKIVCMARRGDEVFAVAHTCPHSGAVLSEGWIDARGYLVCPLHKYRFDMRNGRNVTGEGYVLKRWPVERREDGIYVGMDEVTLGD